MVLSNDGGTTFGAPTLVTTVTRYVHPSIRTGVFLPSAATDRTTGALYVVYQARDGAGLPRILFTKSTNTGATWSAPIAVSDNPSTGVFNPAISASPDGQTLTVSFYDQRDSGGNLFLCNLYLAQSFDGGTTWGPNIRLTSETSDATLAPLTADGYMLGDYLGIAESTSPDVPAVPVWVDTRTGNPDPFITRVGIAPEVDFTGFQASRLSLAQINDPQLGGPDGDADGDAEDNLSEFLSGTEPNDPASVVHTSRQLNISTREMVGTGEDVLIGGLIVSGSTAKQVILRAIGPSLAAFGLSGVLQDPMLELHDNTGALIFSNDNWRETQEAAIEATGLQPNDDREAAIVATLDPGAYTAILQGKNNTTGTALVEAYDLDATAGGAICQHQHARPCRDRRRGPDRRVDHLERGLGAGQHRGARARSVVRRDRRSRRAAGSDARIARQQRRPGGVERQLARHAGRDHHLNRPRTQRRPRGGDFRGAPRRGLYRRGSRKRRDDRRRTGRSVQYSVAPSPCAAANLTLRPGHPMQRGEQSKRS